MFLTFLRYFRLRYLKLYVMKCYKSNSISFSNVFTESINYNISMVRVKFLYLLLLINITTHIIYTETIKTYTIGVQDLTNQLPYSSYINGEYAGLARDILDLFAEKSGYRFIYKAYPIKRLYNLYLGGELDFKFPDNPKWMTDKKTVLDIHYTEMLEFVDGLIVNNDCLGDDLSTVKKIGVPQGFTPSPYLTEIKKGNIKIYYNNNYPGLLKQLIHRKLDAVYMDIFSIYYNNFFDDHYNKIMSFDTDKPYISGYFCLSSFQHTHILEELKTFLKNNKAEVELLKDRYNFDNIKEEIGIEEYK